MKAVAVRPGQPGSAHLRELPRPDPADLAGRAGVLVEVLRVGVDGTDLEIIDGLYGVPPAGDDFLIIGHESLGRAVASGPDASAWIEPGALVVPMVRRPGSSIYDRLGVPDMTTDDVYYERGISHLHGFLAEYYAEDASYLVPLPESLEQVGVLLEPLSIAQKAIRQAFEIQRRLPVWWPKRAAVLGAGTIGLLCVLALRLRGLEVVCYSRRQPPYRNSELIEAIGGVYVSSRGAGMDAVAQRFGPFDLMIEATGFSPLAFEAAEVLGKNGVLVLTSVTAGDRTTQVASDRINQRFVLGNRVMVGTVNAAREDFAEGVNDLLRSEASHPGWLQKMLTTPIHGLEAYREMVSRLRHDEEAIKVFVEVGPVRR